MPPGDQADSKINLNEQNGRCEPALPGYFRYLSALRYSFISCSNFSVSGGKSKNSHAFSLDSNLYPRSK
jgi:hypothetical protein